MTIEEAIKVLRTERVEIGGNAVSVARFLEAVDVAILALRKQESECNDPLTVDELRQMGGEPVYTENNTVRGKFYAWSLVDADREQVRNANGFVKYFSLYGKEWLAYRHKPEEGTE